MLQNLFISYIFTFLDSLLEGLQGFPTSKQIVSLNIGLKRIISDYNQGHIIRELRTRGLMMKGVAHTKIFIVDILQCSKFSLDWS